ncbi:MAG: GNAT family N-acetyltransferase [Pseudomonadota bacterium]
MKAVLRDYTGADQARVDALALQSWEQYRDHYDDWPAIGARIGAMSALAASGEIIVATVDDHIEGAVAYVGPGKPKAEMFKPEWPIMRMLVVAPAARGMGLGRALAQECMRRARRDQARVFALHTSDMMTVALPMYLRMGFEYAGPAPAIGGVPYSIYLKQLHP